MLLLQLLQYWLYWLNSAHLFLCIVLRCLCAECNKGAKLYFCAVFMIFIFFIGIHILFIKTKDL